jgi:hypothetical protein
MDITGSDIMAFVNEYKFWMAVAVPLVIAIVVIKILG